MSFKQKEQQKLRQALGTVIGFHGYLNNLDAVLKACKPTHEMMFTHYFVEKEIRSLKHQLKVAEVYIERQLQSLDKVFPK